MYSFTGKLSDSLIAYDCVKENELCIGYDEYLVMENRDSYNSLVLICTEEDKIDSTKLGDNVKLCYSTLTKKPNIDKPYFTYEVIDTWDMFEYYAFLGVSEMYIGNYFGFQFENIKKIADKRGITLRVYVNVAQSKKPYVEEDMFKSFFIRPEDAHLYEGAILCFFGPADRQRVLHEIYSQGVWRGNLDDLIIGLEMDIDNTRIPPAFGELRHNCGHQCSYDACISCDRVKFFHDELVKTPIKINTPKRKETIDENRRDEILMQLKSRHTEDSLDENPYQE